MKVQLLTRTSSLATFRNDFHSGKFPNNPQDVSRLQLCGEDFVSKLLNRRWALLQPDTKIHQITVSDLQIPYGGGPFGDVLFSNNTHPPLGGSIVERNNQKPFFYVVRDDLLHPLVNGNKARKLDGMLPLIEDHSITDVITCGGCQSAHAAAVAVSCAERGLTSHLLLRGEQPEIPTGYNLVSMMYGNVTYVPRFLYAKREEMLATHANLLAGNSGSVTLLSDIFEASFAAQLSGKLNSVQMHTNTHAENSKKIVIVNEGAGDGLGLLGVIRLVQYLSQNHLLGKEQALKFVVDAGTGTTAVGLGLGAICLGLPWEVTAVMLADTINGYRKQERRLISEFQRCCVFPCIDEVLSKLDGGIVHWVERSSPRKFGNVLTGEVKACQQIAQQTGIPLDPVYTLAAWELATQLSQEAAKGVADVVMLHTGGTLGIFGLAQRYKSYFHMLKNTLSN